MLHEAIASFPHVVPVFGDRCEYVKQVFDVHVFHHDPPRFFEPGDVRVNIDHQPADVMVPDCAKERGRSWISRTKVVSDWRQHRNEAVAPISQRKNAEFIEDLLSVGDGWKKPVKIFLIDALREESNDSEEVA